MQDSELQFSLEGQKTKYYVNIYDHQELTFLVQNLGSTKKAKFSIEISSTPYIKIAPSSIHDFIRSGRSKRYQISLMPKELGVYTISIAFLSHLGEEESLLLQLTVLDCFPKLFPFYEISSALYDLMYLMDDETHFEGRLYEYYNSPENFDIFIIELEHVSALLHLILDLDKKYNGLFSSQVMNYLEDLTTKVTQIKMRLANKERFNLTSEFYSLFIMGNIGMTDKHPLEELRDKLTYSKY